MHWAYYNENDPHMAQWLRNLIRRRAIMGGEVDERSIKDVDPDDVRGYTRTHWFAGLGAWDYALQLAGWPKDRQVATMSCPCQPYSVAGMRKGQDDERDLWGEGFRIIEAVRPDTLFGEQVASADVIGKANGGKPVSNGSIGSGTASVPPVWIDRIRIDLERARYAFGTADIPAAGVGAPHIRSRICWVADAQNPNGRRTTDTADEGRRIKETGGSGCVNGMAHANHPRSQRRGEQRFRRSGQRIIGAGGMGIDRTGDFWSEFRVVECPDGRRRIPVAESGVFPLAPRSAFDLGRGGTHEGRSRSGMLRGYGNCIVPQVAAEFIRAFMKCRP